MLYQVPSGSKSASSTTAGGCVARYALRSATIVQLPFAFTRKTPFGIVGTPCEQTGDVYKITIGRDDLKLTEMGAAINARMGLNTWAALVGTNDKAAIAGDVAMLANEVPAVLKALRKNGLDVVAIHHHMTGTEPTIFFLHYWGTGPAEKLATGFRAALAELGRPQGPSKH